MTFAQQTRIESKEVRCHHEEQEDLDSSRRRSDPGHHRDRFFDVVIEAIYARSSFGHAET